MFLYTWTSFQHKHKGLSKWYIWGVAFWFNTCKMVESKWSLFPARAGCLHVAVVFLSLPVKLSCPPSCTITQSDLIDITSLHLHMDPTCTSYSYILYLHINQAITLRPGCHRQSHCSKAWSVSLEVQTKSQREVHGGLDLLSGPWSGPLTSLLLQTGGLLTIVNNCL